MDYEGWIFILQVIVAGIMGAAPLALPVALVAYAIRRRRLSQRMLLAFIALECMCVWLCWEVDWSGPPEIVPYHFEATEPPHTER